MLEMSQYYDISTIIHIDKQLYFLSKIFSTFSFCDINSKDLIYSKYY